MITIIYQAIYGGDNTKSFEESRKEFYFGYGKNEYSILDDLSYNFTSFNYVSENSTSGTRITIGILNRPDQNYKPEERYYILMPKMYKNWTYIGVNLGFCLGLLDQGDSPNFVLPVAGIKMGDLDRLFVSVDFLNEDLLSPFEISINYTFLNKHTLLSVGALRSDTWFLKIKTLQFSYLYLAVSGAYDFSEKAPGFRIGIGTGI